MSCGRFVSWAPFSRRTETLAQEFNLDLNFVSTPWPKRPWVTPAKYPWQTAATAALLRRTAPQELWVMDPPSPLVALAGSWAARHGVPLVVDMHTVAFTAREWELLRPVELPALQRARLVVTTSRRLAERVQAWGAHAFVLPDPVPQAPDASHEPVDPMLVTVVATYSKDEPLRILPDVARRLPSVRIAVTGSPRGNLSSWPANLRPTGFLSDDEYWRQLARSAVVVVLTTRRDTLLSGGYEALALGRPLVTSDHAVLREYFGDSAIYAAVDGASVAAAVSTALAAGDDLTARMGVLRRAREAEWRDAAQCLRAAIGRAT